MAHRAAQTWQPQKYLKFERVRLRPALELLERVRELPSTASSGDDDVVEIIDLGAGTGNMAPSFFKRWPRARVTFVDSSASMLERAKQEHSVDDNVKTEQCAYLEADFESFQPDKPVDLIFSNAALHWYRQGYGARHVGNDVCASARGDNPVADFVGSTGLRPFMEALADPSTAASEFEHKYRELIVAAYPKQCDGRMIFNFKRFFAVATKPLEA
ncbi:Coiled-coil domain-containing protein 94 [Phytophthora nicotianae]|uniref:Coiled-coil domain-containing protein 94 n=1 Tax=Phytophthora nicotianae TaxID=4792 RepID=A0A0W8DM97_PHYNI|nr:Coiled-coil domain-containing protein 94 [Phytophthora nicotianae]